jgi:hypothetical protein
VTRRAKDHLTIDSTLNHDGDGVVHYRIVAENAGFRGATGAWGNAEDALTLASALVGFPNNPQQRVEFEFGSPGVGLCRLEFRTVDSLGHCCVWADIEGSFASSDKDKFQRSLVCINFLPASLDEFCTQLPIQTGARE